MLYVALLHSILLPKGRLVMADLRDLAAGLGLSEPRTVAATGNLVFEGGDVAASELEQKLEAAYAERFGRALDIIVRDAASFRRTVAANPFPDADSALVMARLQRAPLPPETAQALEKHRPPEDELRIVGGDVWVKFAAPPSSSRLLSALTTQRLGVGTSRILNTLRKLDEMLG